MQRESMVFHAGTFWASLGTERKRWTAAPTFPAAESCLSCRARSYGRRSFLGMPVATARTRLGVNITKRIVFACYYILCNLRSTRLAANPIINKDMNAAPTTVGFFRCADNGTLYETCSYSSEDAIRRRSTYIDHRSVLVSQVLVCH